MRQIHFLSIIILSAQLFSSTTFAAAPSEVYLELSGSAKTLKNSQTTTANYKAYTTIIPSPDFNSLSVNWITQDEAGVEKAKGQYLFKRQNGRWQMKLVYSKVVMADFGVADIVVKNNEIIKITGDARANDGTLFHVELSNSAGIYHNSVTATDANGIEISKDDLRGFPISKAALLKVIHK